jgi:hypothetical protein
MEGNKGIELNGIEPAAGAPLTRATRLLNNLAQEIDLFLCTVNSTSDFTLWIL